jgi:hypothetical protein
VTEKIDGEGYDALVAAMQRALVRFGQRVGDSVSAARIATFQFTVPKYR